MLEGTWASEPAIAVPAAATKNQFPLKFDQYKVGDISAACMGIEGTKPKIR